RARARRPARASSRAWRRAAGRTPRARTRPTWSWSGLLRASRQLGHRDVTGDPVGRARARPRRLGLLADAADLLRAARVERASRRWVLRARHAAFEADRPSPPR